MRARLYYWRCLIRDFLRYGKLSGWIISRALAALSRLCGSPIQRLALLTRAARLQPTRERIQRLKPAMDACLAQLDPDRIDWNAAGAAGRNDMGKGIILKPPVSPREKGVLYLTFEKQWLRLLRTGKVNEIAQLYDVILGPSSSPPPHVEMLLMAKLWPGRLFSMLGNLDDSELLAELSPKLTESAALSGSEQERATLNAERVARCSYGAIPESDWACVKERGQRASVPPIATLTRTPAASFCCQGEDYFSLSRTIPPTEDFRQHGRLKLTSLPLLASSWIVPEDFTPHLSRTKDHDIVMLAHFDPVKRHWLLFNALRKLPRSCRVLLMGVPLGGRDENDLMREARAFGVQDRFDLLVRPSRAEVMSGLAKSRISLVFSRQEGACIAVAESLFADTPVGLFRNARIGSKAFINTQTGRLLGCRNLASQLQQFVEEAERYSPRAWALRHISCHESLAVLNRALKQAALDEGREWTRDAVPFRKDLVPSYLSRGDEEAMRGEYENFANRFGLLLGPAAKPGWLRRECVGHGGER